MNRCKETRPCRSQRTGHARKLTLALPALVACGGAPTQTTTRPVDTAEKAAAHPAVDAVFSAYDRADAPGCALGVIRDGEFVYRRGYGMASLEYSVPLDSGSVFRIGSTSKQFTAAAILLLAEEGKLGLDDDVRTHLPELRDYGTPITIRQLLHHTSGIRDYLALMALADREGEGLTEREALALIARQEKLNFAPGARFLYSNSGYFLLALIVERVSKQTLAEYAADRIFTPLAMKRTHFHDDHAVWVPHRAQGYAPKGDVFVLSMTTLDLVGDGGVFTTIDDLGRWDANFYGNRLGAGGTRLIEQLLAPGHLASGKELRYTAGLGRMEHRGLDVVLHGGAFVGFRAEMIRVPAHRFSVIVLCNRADAQPTKLGLDVLDIYLADHLGPDKGTDLKWHKADETEREPLKPADLPPEALRSFAGTYHSGELDISYDFEERDGSLFLVVGEFSAPLASFEHDRFTLMDTVRIRFLRRDGAVTGFELDEGRANGLHFERR
jgi:CubicO group peptidase (beta-lactamase class C family)